MGERQRGPSTGNLSDQIASLDIQFDILQGLFSRLQLLLHTGGLSGHQGQCSRPDPQQWSGVQRCFGQGSQPIENGDSHAAKMQAHFPAFNQALGTLDIIGGSRMAKSLKHQVIVFIPPAGTDVVFGHVVTAAAAAAAAIQQRDGDNGTSAARCPRG